MINRGQYKAIRRTGIKKQEPIGPADKLKSYGGQQPTILPEREINKPKGLNRGSIPFLPDSIEG